MIFSGTLIVLFIICCSTVYKASGNRWNLAAIYNPGSSHLHPSYRVYHNTDNQSLLLIKLFPNELLFNQANPTGEYLSQVSVQLQNFEIIDGKPLLVDSITYRYSIKQENVGRRYLTQIPFKAEMGKRYQLRVVAHDLLRKDFNLKFIEIDKTNEFSEQNYNLLNAQGIPYFNNVVSPENVYRIEHRNNQYGKIYIEFYKNEAPLPEPSFTTSSDERIYSKPDSIYVFDYNASLLLSFSYQGMYFFRFDTSQPHGLALVNFDEDFPKIKSANQMLEPLAYITTTADYKKLLDEENSKLATDNFWLKLGGSTGRARELIRIYYNRVYFANYYFTGTKPGWKTDRGMIYVVYGPPQNIQKTSGSETWIYYTKGASSTIDLVFDYRPNPYNLENFVLRRSESHDWHWREAVDSWRAGRVFLQE